MPKAPSLTLSQKILATRKAWGWSQSQFGAALCCDQASISFWETGRITPSGSAITALACLFGIRVQDLVNDGPFEAPAAPAAIPAFEHLMGKGA